MAGFSIGNGVDTSYDVTHNLNTEDVIIQVYETLTGENIGVETKIKDNDTVTISFNTPPSKDQYTLVVTPNNADWGVKEW